MGKWVGGLAIDTRAVGFFRHMPFVWRQWGEGQLCPLFAAYADLPGTFSHSRPLPKAAGGRHALTLFSGGLPVGQAPSGEFWWGGYLAALTLGGDGGRAGARSGPTRLESRFSSGPCLAFGCFPGKHLPPTAKHEGAPLQRGLRWSCPLGGVLQAAKTGGFFPNATFWPWRMYKLPLVGALPQVLGIFQTVSCNGLAGRGPGDAG